MVTPVRALRPNTRRTLVALRPLPPIEAFERPMVDEPSDAPLPRWTIWSVWGVVVLACLAVWALSIIVIVEWAWR
jgi:hypothetical protein